MGYYFFLQFQDLVEVHLDLEAAVRGVEAKRLKTGEEPLQRLPQLNLNLTVLRKLLAPEHQDKDSGIDPGKSYIYTCTKTRDIHVECSKLLLLCVWTELAVLGSTKTALKFKYEI